MATKHRKREQAKKVNKHEDKAWMRARLDQSNSNLRVPSGTVYKRKPKHREW